MSNGEGVTCVQVYCRTCSQVVRSWKIFGRRENWNLILHFSWECLNKTPSRSVPLWSLFLHYVATFLSCLSVPVWPKHC